MRSIAAPELWRAQLRWRAVFSLTCRVSSCLLATQSAVCVANEKVMRSIAAPELWRAQLRWRAVFSLTCRVSSCLLATQSAVCVANEKVMRSIAASELWRAQLRWRAVSSLTRRVSNCGFFMAIANLFNPIAAPRIFSWQPAFERRRGVRFLRYRSRRCGDPPRWRSGNPIRSCDVLGLV